MNSLLSTRKTRLAAAVIFIVAIGLFFWRPTTLALPAFTTKGAQETNTGSTQSFSLEKAIALFDLSVLPPKPAPIVNVQAVDPTAAIQRHQLIGVTINQTGAFALISDGAHTFNIVLGDMLDGFVVNKIHPRRVEFKKGDVVAVLELPETVQ